MSFVLLFREHRESLADSMATVKEIKDWDDLKKLYPDSKVLCCRWYARDERIGWDTYLISDEHGAIGMTNGPIPCGNPEGKK